MKSRYFDIQELVDEITYKARGEKAWELLDPNLIKVIDRIKEEFSEGTMVINNWQWGGPRSESGLRNAFSRHYSPYSQHSLGKAVDCIFSAYETEEVRQYIIDNIEKFPEIKGIEKGVSWLHIDVRNRDELLIFSA